MVEWGVFIAGLKKVVTDIKADEEIVLKYILGTFLFFFFNTPIDNANTGFINQHKFSEFLKGFGPVQDCIRSVKSICSSKYFFFSVSFISQFRWFYGFLSRNETELLLRDQQPGKKESEQ